MDTSGRRQGRLITAIAVEGRSMTLIDYFAAFILVVLILCAVAVFVSLGMAPGRFAKRRNHPWAQAVEIAGWVTLVCGFFLWPLALLWAFVDAPAPPRRTPAS